MNTSDLLAVAAVAAFVVLFVALTVRAWRAEPTPQTYRARVYGEPGEVMRDLQLAMSGLRNTVTHRSGDDSLTAARTYAPTWTIVVSVLFFPLGLLALLARKTVTGTVVVEGANDGTTTLTFGGAFHGTARAAINSVINARSARTPQRTA